MIVEPFLRDGYVVARGLVPRDLCSLARRMFRDEVKPFKGFIFRQSTGMYERHKFTSGGFVKNAILDVQSMARTPFPNFRSVALDVLTYPSLQDALKLLLDAPGVKLAQSMYFESNGENGTWPHQDSYYIDNVDRGRLVAAWIALEDIQEAAGRFFVYPGTHRHLIAENGDDMDVAYNHDQYKQFVQSFVRDNGIEPVSPVLEQGDVLFWHPNTVHGSYPPDDPTKSRNSFTAHYVPRDARVLHFHSRVIDHPIVEHNGVAIHMTRDPSKLKNRALFHLATKAPFLYAQLHRAWTKAHTR